MPWTDEHKLAYLLKLPWTIVPEVTPEGDRLLRVKELPAVAGCGETEDALATDFWAALEAALRSYLHFGDPLPRPQGAVLPWEADPAGAPSYHPIALKLWVRLVQGRAQPEKQGVVTRSDRAWQIDKSPERDLVKA